MDDLKTIRLKPSWHNILLSEWSYGLSNILGGIFSFLYFIILLVISPISFFYSIGENWRLDLHEMLSDLCGYMFMGIFLFFYGIFLLIKGPFLVLHSLVKPEVYTKTYYHW